MPHIAKCTTNGSLLSLATYNADPDDDKFVDCAVSANADFLVTNDRHYGILKNIPFPHLKVIRIEEFLEILVASE
jgi:predicted nucleic acid-binding protein